MAGNIEPDMILWDNFYKEKCKIKSINPEVKLDIGDFYVNLEGVKCNDTKDVEKQEKKFNVEQSTNFARRDNQNLGRRIKKDVVVPIRPEDILAGSKKRILIYGSPGTGKTTICKKIVYDFYKKKTWNGLFTNIIWIQLRNIKDEHCMKILDGVNDDLITTQRNVVRILFEISGKTSKDWATILDNKEANVLYILDGWDEIYHLIEDHKRLKNLMDMFYKQENVILTTRPYAYVNFKDFEQIFEITGFNPENIGKYTRKVLSIVSKSGDFEAVMEYIETTVVNDLATIPILLDIFLFCWDDIQHFKETLTMTRLYERLFLRLWMQFLDRIGERRKKVKTLFELQENENLCKLNDQLCNLGHKWLEKGTLDFNSYDINLGENNINHVFFLNQTSTNNPNEERFTFEFIHLTICEFFAALYIVKRTMESETFLTEFVPSHKYNTRLNVVFQFTAGLFEIVEQFKTENSALKIFFDCLEADPFDLLGTYHYPLLVNCLAECNIEPKRAAEINDEIFQFISSRQKHLKMFVKLPIQLVEMVLREGNREIQMGLMNFKHRLPPFSKNIITDIQSLEVKDSEKLKLLCLQVTHSEESKLCIYNLCTAIEEEDITIFHDIESNLNFLPSEMKLHIIKNVVTEELVKIDVCGTLANVFLKTNDLAEVCRIFEPSIAITDSLENIIKALLNSEEVQSRRSINNLKFLKNIEGWADVLLNQIKEKLESNLEKQRDKSIFHWISSFEIMKEDIVEKLILLPDNTDMEKNLKHKAMLCLLELYRGKDISKQASKFIIKHFQSLHISKDTSKLDDLIEVFRNCGSMAAEEEEIFNNWVVLSYQEDYSPYLLENRKFNEKQMRVLITKHQNNIEAIKFVLLEHLELDSVKTFLCRNGVQSTIVKTLKRHMMLRRIPHLDKYPKEFKELVDPNYAEVILHNLSSEIAEKIAKVKNTLLNFREFQRGALLLSEYQDEEKKRIEDCYIQANSYFGLDDAQKVAAMLYNFENDLGKIKYSLYSSHERVNLEPDFVDKIKLQCDNLHDDYLGYFIFKQLTLYMGVIRSFPSYFVKFLTAKNYQQIFHLLCREIDVTEQQVPVYFYRNIFYFGIYNSKLENETDLKEKGILSSYIDNCTTSLGVDRCCRNIRLNAKKDFKKYALKANFNDIRNIKENTKLMESIIGGSYWNSGSNKELIENFIGSYNHALREVLNNELGLMEFPYGNEALIKFEREAIKTCKYVFESYRPLDHQTRLTLARLISKQKCTEMAPLRNILLSFFHLDFSGRNNMDEDISEEFTKFVKEGNVHTIILSENLITLRGFHAILATCCRPSSKVKHLFLDRNHVFFNEAYFNNMIETLKNDKREKPLEVLDICGNFVSQNRIEELCKQNKMLTVSDNFSYAMINNCKLILSRKIKNNSALAAVDFIKEKEEVYIDEEKGCVAIAQMTDTLLGYSGHHLLIIEKFAKGQRTLVIAELFAVNKNSCTIQLKEVESIQELKNRMEKYSIKRANFPEGEIKTLLNVIGTSKQQQDFLRYEIDFDGDGMNCVKWVIKIMKNITDCNVVEIDTPPSVFMKLISLLRRIRDERRRPRIVISFLAFIVTVLAVLFSLYI